MCSGTHHHHINQSERPDTEITETSRPKLSDMSQRKKNGEEEEDLKLLQSLVQLPKKPSICSCQKEFPFRFIVREEQSFS
jgi:hypothetical protein